MDKKYRLIKTMKLKPVKTLSSEIMKISNKLNNKKVSTLEQRALCEDGSVWEMNTYMEEKIYVKSLWHNIVPPVKETPDKEIKIIYSISVSPPEFMSFSEFITKNFINSVEFQIEKDLDFIFHCFHRPSKGSFISRDLITRKNQIEIFKFFLKHAKLEKNELYTYE